MKKMSIRSVIIGILASALILPSLAFGQSGTINQLTQWIVSGGYVKTSSSTAKIQVQGLASPGDCVVTDASGKFSTATCGSGGGVSGGTAGTIATWVNGTTLTGSSSPTVNYITATSGTSSLANLNVSGGVNIGGSFFTNLLTFLTSACTTITGGSGLCDGIDATGLATSSPVSNSNVLVYNSAGGGSAYGVATGTISGSTGISVTAGQSVIGSGLTVTNTSPLSGLTASFPFSFANPVLTWLGLSTTTNTGLSQGNLYIGAGGIMQTGASSTIFGYTPLNPTRNINTTYPLQGGGDLSADRTLTIAFGTTTANTWANIQTFTSGIVAQATSSIAGLTSSSSYLGNIRNVGGFFQDGLTDCTGTTFLQYTLSTGKYGCGTPAGGGGGSGDSVWSRSSSGAIYTPTTTDSVVIGATATNTNSRLQVEGTTTATSFVATGRGSSTIAGSLEVGGLFLTPTITATNTAGTSTFYGVTDLVGDIYMRSVSANTFLRLNSVDKVIGSSYIDLASGDVGGILPGGAGGTGRDAGTMGGTTGAYASADGGLFYWNETLQFFENNSSMRFDAGLGAGTLLLQAPPRINDLSGGSACSVAGGFALGTDNDGDVECVTLPVSGGSGVGTISTSTQEVSGQIPFYTTTNGYPAQLGSSEYIRWNGSDTLLLGSSTDGNGIIGISYSGIASQYGNFPALSFGASSTYFGFDGSNLPFVSLFANDTGDSSAGNAIIGPGAGEVAIVSSTSERVATFASSTSGTSSFSGGLFALNSLFGGNQYKVASCDLKADATTGAFYCGTDATGGSGGGLASSSPWTKGQITAVASDGALYGVSSSTASFSGPFRGYSTLGNLVGGSNSTIVWTGIATTTNLTGGQVLMSNGGAGVSSVATGTVSSGTGISVTAGQSIIGSGLTITNTGVTSLSGAYPLSFSGSTGAITASFNGLATSSTWTAGRLAMVLNGNTVTSIATTTVTCAGTVSCTSFVIPGSTPITLTGSGGSGSPKTYSYIVDADGLGDFTTIQGALDACATAGGGSIYLTDHYYYLGGTGLKFKSNDCNVYGVYASTTIEIAGATSAFSTNSAASAYANNGVHNVVIVGDGNTGSIGIDMSNMIRSRYTGIVMDNVGRGFRLNDTQDVTFYNTVRDFAITTIQVAGIDASSTNPTNDNKFSDGFIGCAVSGCVGINLNNAQNNLFSGVSIEPATITGTIGVKIDVDARATNSGTFANQFYGLYAEANKIGIAASSSISSTKAIHSNGFYGGQIVANTTDTLDSSNGESISFFGVNINYTQVNQMATTTFKGGTYFAGLGDCDTALTSKVLYDVTTGRFSCGTDQSGGGGGGGSGAWATNTAGTLTYLSSSWTALIGGTATTVSGSLLEVAGTATVQTLVATGSEPSYFTTGVGVGSTTPWAEFSVIRTDSDYYTSPIVAFGRSLTNGLDFFLTGTTSYQFVDGIKSIFGLGTTTDKFGQRLTKNITLAGKVAKTHPEISCTNWGQIAAITADTNNIPCPGLVFDETTDADIIRVSSQYATTGVQTLIVSAGTTAGAGSADAGTIRTLDVKISGTSSPSMEFYWNPVPAPAATNTAGRIFLAGFTSENIGGNFARIPANGVMLAASGTMANIQFITVNGGTQTVTDTGVASTTSENIALTTMPKWEIGYSTVDNVAYLIRNGVTIARHTTNITTNTLSSFISASPSPTGATQSSVANRPQYYFGGLVVYANASW